MVTTARSAWSGAPRCVRRFQATAAKQRRRCRDAFCRRGMTFAGRCIGYPHF
jgi:hypothetical protein